MSHKPAADHSAQTSPAQEPLHDRRPLTSRSAVWAVKLAGTLARTSISPNQISMLSVVAAAVALAAMALSASLGAPVPSGLCLIVAAIACQLRLLCNLMDGMVAIEAGKKTRDGAFWNEFPDRVADILILVGLGVAADAVSLGWAVAGLAVFTAYVRELGKGIDGVTDFRGPLAKPHRMALATAALLLAGICTMASERSAHYTGMILQATLWVLVVGIVLTLYLRSRALLGRLR